MAGILPDDEVSARKVTIATIYLLSIFFLGGLRRTGCATSYTLASEVNPDHAALQLELDTKVELLAESPKVVEEGTRALISGQTSLAILIQEKEEGSDPGPPSF